MDKRDIIPALAQGRHLDLEHNQPLEQVLEEFLGLHGLLGGLLAAASTRISTARGSPPPPWKAYRRRCLEEGEERYLRELMRHSLGNVGRASRVSGLSPSRLYDLLRKYRLPTRF